MNLFKPFVSDESKYLVNKVLSGTQLAEGLVVQQFEKEFAEKYNIKNVAAVNSGTSALHLAYILAGVKPGDEVITPVLSCTATNIPIIQCGGVPVFADVTEDLVIDPQDIAHRITSKTKAIVFVHFGGCGEGLKEVQRIAKTYNLPVIEDAAQVIGSNDEWGTSEFTCISLQAIKTLTAGDGGLLLCKDDELHEKAKRLRWLGIDRPKKQELGDIDVKEVGYKYHMNNIAAAIGLGNLRNIDKLLEKRENVADMYEQSSIVNWLLIRPWLVILRHPEIKTIEKAFEKEDIKISGHHYRNDKYTIFGGRRNDLPNMDEIEDTYTLLPFHHDITHDDIKKIELIIMNTLS
jgi:dTDP-4-amino-4,6-dideoxygalactose transaminase